MSKGVNKWIGIGNCCADPQARALPSGSTVTNISIACNDSYKDKATGEKKDNTEFVRIVFFNRLAEIAAQYLKKGSKIYVEGSLKTRKWQDNNGQDRYSTEIVAKELQMLDSRGAGQEQRRGPVGELLETDTVAGIMPEPSPGCQADDVYSASEPKGQSVNDTQAEALDDDIPF